MNDSWQKAQVLAVKQVGEDMLQLVVKPTKWKKHRAGQHYQLRIDREALGRSYSIVSSPLDEGRLEFGVQLIPIGAVSPKLWKLVEGDEIELSGPFGEGFVWTESMNEPILLLGAGSGITPLIAIHRHFKATKPQGKIKFVMSAKRPTKIMNYDLLKNDLITRFTEAEGRIDKTFLQNMILDMGEGARVYVCGPIEFIDDMVDCLLELGVRADNIRAERFI